MRDFLANHLNHIGLAFLTFVVGLLIYLNVFVSAVVGQERFQLDSVKTPDVLICEEDPEIITAADLTWADDLWDPLGYGVGELRSVPCGSLKLCDAREEGDPEPRWVSCQPGSILVSLRDQAFSEEHAGETLSGVDESGHVVWATILLPLHLYESEELTSVERLPKNVKAIVLAHEIGHWWGFDHSKTPIIGPFVSEKTGEVMNSSIYDSGEGIEGIPHRTP